VIVDNSSGNLRILLETGTNDRYANYVSGNSTSILSFLYTVQSGDNSSDLDFKATDSLSANNATIRDTVSLNANLTLPSPGASGSLAANKAIVIDNTAPTVSNISPTDNLSAVSISDNITVTFSEAMDNSSVTTNTDNTTCYGSFQLSSDNFSSCIQMSSTPSSSNLGKTYTIVPSDNLSYVTTYKNRVTTGVKDIAGNNLSSQYESSNGFKTTVAFIAMGSNGLLLTSPDGTTWNLRTTDVLNALFMAAHRNNTYVVVGYMRQIVTSTDAITWTKLSLSFGYDIMGVAFGDNTFVSVTGSGVIGTSSDNGTNWSMIDHEYSHSGYDLFDVKYLNGKFYTVGVGGMILTSTDQGQNWTRQTSGTTVSLREITYGNGLYVVVGLDGTIITSSNGINWTTRTSGTSEDLKGVSYGNGLYVVVGHDGTIITSSNGTTWTTMTSGTENDLQDVTFGNSKFVAVGGYGNINIFTSTDNGSTWSSINSGTNQYMYGIFSPK
jgi:photosystem II stability/assembly factor-like uncharacterized protein